MPDGGFERPGFEVLRDASLVPPENQVRPPPNRFTHRLVEDAPFCYGTTTPGVPADGQLAAGTRVVLLVDDGQRARVVDGRGLYVEVASVSLVRLRAAPTRRSGGPGA